MMQAVTADEVRLERFADALNAIRRRVEAQVGDEDLAYFRRLERLSTALHVAGRTLIYTSLEPVTFFAGVTALWLHKQIDALEIGHTMLHGVFDHLPAAKKYHSRTYRWNIPVDERAWMRSHGSRHHAHPNVAGKDDIIHFGLLRINEHTPWRWYHRFQLPYTLFVLGPAFGFAANVHVTGLHDLVVGNGRPERFDFLRDRSLATAVDCVKEAMRKWVPYYGKNYALYSLLAGPLFPKVLLGNFLAETMRDLWVSATIFTNHIVDTANYPEGTRAGSRGAFYAMQVEATHDYAASRWVSILSGGLDHHIEHHLFPRLPPNRLREIRAEVQAVCEAHGVRYRRERSFAKLLWRSLARIAELSRRNKADAT
jgi:linoleoyl-CoA desaturase